MHKCMADNGVEMTFEYPLQQLKFRGVPFRSNVAIMPTVKCLVALQEWPALCIPFSQVEVAVFERFSLELKEFDLILIPKNYFNPVWKITAVPNREFADRIKVEIY